MKTSTTLRTTAAVAILAGAGLAGCAGDPYYDNRGYSGYNQPVYHSQRYYETNAQGYYYDSSNPNRRYYTDHSGYYYESPR